MQAKTKKWIALAVTLALAGGGAAWYFTRGGEGEAGNGKPQGRRGFDPNRAIPVRVAAAKNGDIELTITALGTVTARNTATVRSRVDGQLMRVAFREGQMVKAGDLLAEIDTRPFQVQLEQAAGQLARDRALLANARLDLERYRGLLAKDSIARQQVDAQASLVQQYEGAVQTDQAQVDSAKLQLAYARVTAPIPGRLGLRLVDTGNIVRAGDATGIVVITQTQPINVVFAVPAEHVATVAARLAGSEPLRVEALDRDGGKVLASGKLTTLDNQIDAATGTVKLKAEFANVDNALFPNQFVNARLRTETRQGATLVPAAAVQRGAQGTFVYVVGAESKVALKPVTVGPTQGDTVAIEKGVAVGEQLVVDGADKLRDGGRVEVVTDAGAARPSGGQAAANGEGRRGKRGGDGAAAGGGEGGSAEERQKRWAETNARIERGEFGEEIKKLPEEERRQKMRELRRQREAGEAGGAARAGAAGGQNRQ
jgi:multidrug efflux system membrane fusion protein